ncbi:MAG: ABC transporter ATP-binding protein [Planctomycetota bacterium]
MDETPSSAWYVRADGLWKRYCRTLRRSTLLALGDGVRQFCGLGPPRPSLRTDEFWSVRDVSFSLAAGQSLALLGRNGAGKSTILRMLSGVIAPDCGELRVRGRLVSLMVVGAGFHPVLTGRENVFIYGSLLGLSRRQIDERLPEMLEFAEIEGFLDTPVKYYSTGMYMRLAFSVASFADPQVFLLDEVLAVGDQAFREKCVAHLQQLKADGCALLIVSHSPGYVRRLADFGLWLERGQPVAYGPIDDVLDAYMARHEPRGEDPDQPRPVSATTSVTVPVSTPPPPPSDDDGQAAADAPPVAEAARLQLLDVGEAPLALTSGAVARLRVAVSLRNKLVEPRLDVSLRNEQGAGLAGVILPLGSSTDGGASCVLDFDLRCFTTAGPAVLRLQLLDRGEGLVAETSHSCEVSGVATSRWQADLTAEVELVAVTGDAAAPPTPAPAAVISDDGDRPLDRADRRLERIEAGDEVEVAVDVCPIEARPGRWQLLDAADGVVYEHDLGLVPAGRAAVRGRFRAWLPGGSYRQIVVIGDAPEPSVWRGGWCHVGDHGEPIGHAALAAGVSTAFVEPGGRHGDAIQLLSLTVDGESEELATLLGGVAGPRLVADLGRGDVPTVPLALGERCRMRLRLGLRPGLRSLEIVLGFTRADGHRSGGLRIRRDCLPRRWSELDAEIDLRVALAPGEYALALAVSGLTREGDSVHEHRAEVARCHVLGPAGLEGDAAMAVLDVREEPGGELVVGTEAQSYLGAFRLNGVDASVGPAVLAAPDVELTVDVCGVRQIAKPELKFSFVTPGLHLVGRAVRLSDRFPSAPLAAGARRRCVLRFRPELVGGAYLFQLALQEVGNGSVHVLDRRPTAIRCVVPIRGASRGRALLEGSVCVDPWQASTHP